MRNTFAGSHKEHCWKCPNHHPHLVCCWHFKGFSRIIMKLTNQHLCPLSDRRHLLKCLEKRVKTAYLPDNVLLTTRISIQASMALVHMLQHNHTSRLMQHTHCLCPSFYTELEMMLTLCKQKHNMQMMPKKMRNVKHTTRIIR